MLKILIYPQAARHIINVKLLAKILKNGSRAILLGKSGEQLRTFPLIQGTNELSISGFEPGQYTIRVESGNEVLVKQIYLD
jgi:hypothetical protein